MKTIIENNYMFVNKIKNKIKFFSRLFSASLDILINFGIHSTRLKTGKKNTESWRCGFSKEVELFEWKENLKNSKIFENITG